MTFSEENLAGCARIFLKVLKFTTETQLGCFGTSLNEDSNIDSIDENKRNRETDISSNQNERTGDTDTSSNQNARMEGKTMEISMEEKWKIYGLSLMFLFLINQ